MVANDLCVVTERKWLINGEFFETGNTCWWIFVRWLGIFFLILKLRRRRTWISRFFFYIKLCLIQGVCFPRWGEFCNFLKLEKSAFREFLCSITLEIFIIKSRRRKLRFFMLRYLLYRVMRWICNFLKLQKKWFFVSFCSMTFEIFIIKSWV